MSSIREEAMLSVCYIPQEAKTGADTCLHTEQIKKMIKDIKRHPFKGVGKPEPLKYGLSGL